MNWNDYKYFSEFEFRCSATDLCEMEKYFLDRLTLLRMDYDRPMIITSGFRHNTHPVEAEKLKGGSHTEGVACDVKCNAGMDSYDLVKLALKHNFSGIGVCQKEGKSRFIHLDLKPRVAIWSY